MFALHAYLVLLFGDMPAVAMIMKMKGHNGLSPCRACRIQGVRAPGAKTLYTPLHRPPAPLDPLNLPLRTHDTMMQHALQVSDPTVSAAEGNARAKRFGINGVSILSTLSSISFPASFPHDFMHLLENLIPALVSLWTGTYKDIHGGRADYIFSGSALEALGDACAASSRTVPAVFGARIPNIATQRYQFIAETWILFATLLGPALLHRHFSKKEYYHHFVNLVSLVNLCLQLELSDEDILTIEHGFAAWVKEYEE
ncbi:hypothetical protein K523DRAFT_236192 [Schizophyllum commune Tattone D]|nr:hypothetical protein K523DRAFT_236192 [Schizophyllum commune Tattone D]